MVPVFSIRVPGLCAEALEKAKHFFAASGGVAIREEETSVSLRRGTARARLFSSRLELWPMNIDLRVVPLVRDEVLLTLSYRLRRTRRFFGASDLLVLEVEAAALEACLCGRPAIDVSAALHPLRSQVSHAMRLNVGLAVVIVVWAGRMAGLAWPWVVLAALAIAALDALVIAAFADLVVEATRRVPPAPHRPTTSSTGDQR